MNKLMIPMACLLLAVAPRANAQEVRPNVATAQQSAGVLKFNEMVHDYGEVPEGPNAEYDFVFRNKGNKPVVISNAVGSCGCTTADWTHEPILPGQKGKIHVIYHTQQRPGTISKQVTVTSDASEPVIVLQIKGTVKSKMMGMVSGK